MPRPDVFIDQQGEAAVRQAGAASLDVTQLFESTRSAASVISGTLTAGTRADRGNAVNEQNGDRWLETDTGLVYYYASGWHYETGVATGADGSRFIPSADDNGALWLVTDTNPRKLYEVSGGAWVLLATLLSVEGDAVTDYTDSVGGSVSSTLAAIPDPANAPVDADALRDDLVANVLPAIRNAISSIASKENATRQELRDTGVIA